MLRKHGNNRRWRHRRRGNALLEFAMVLPFLATIIVLTFFFGWAMMRQQQVRISARYAAWRPVRTDSRPDVDEINETFFHDRANVVTCDYDGGPWSTVDGLVLAAGDYTAEAQAWAEFFTDARCPGGSMATVRATFEPPVAAWAVVEGPIRVRNGRDGVPWRNDDGVDGRRELRDRYWPELDQVLESLEQQGSTLSEFLREGYLYPWRTWQAP